MSTKKKVASAAAAVAAAGALLLTGTFAWQSISQTALNEASDIVNPGGRLHDDFYIDDNGDYNADIYVENFADDEIFARVRLEEYMEVVINYTTDAAIPQTLVGGQNEDYDETALNIAKNKDGTELYERTYTTYIFEDTNKDADTGIFNAATDSDGKSWFSWTPGSAASAEVYYMPTFNMNKDSLVADRNGMYVDRIGGISNRSQNQYEEWNVWAYGDTDSGTEIYDVDTNTLDEVKYDFENLTTYVDAGNIKTVDETHTAATVGATNGLISMEEWLGWVEYDEDGNPTNIDSLGDYWVYDTDGWVYWSSPIAGGETTGLLLDSIELNQVMDDTWYYAINAIGQFCTAGDVDGFYNDGEAPSENAETLLEAIGAGTGEASDNEEGFVASAGTLTGINMSLYADNPYISIDETTNTLIANPQGGWQQVDIALSHDTLDLPFSATENAVYKWSDADGDYIEHDNEIVDIVTYKDQNQVDVFLTLGADGMYKITSSYSDEEGNTYEGSIEFTIEVYESVIEDEEPEIIDQPLDVYVSYEADGTIAGSQPIDPETGKPSEDVIQIFATRIEYKPMYLGGQLTREDGSVLDSRNADSGLTVSYTFEAYDAYMAYTHEYFDDTEHSETFTISTIDDETSQYYGYKVATCDDTGEQMVVLNEATGHLVMLAENQPMNQTLTVKATTTYNGTTYESNPQQIFFVNRDINLFLDGDPASEEGYYGYYTPGEETTFTMTAELLFENEPDTSRTIIWSILDEDNIEINDDTVTVTPDSESSYKATVVVSEGATGDYTVLATYNHTADDGKNKGLYQTGWGIRSTGSGDDEEYEPEFHSWIEASPNGYIQNLSNNNVTLSLVGLYGADYVTEELTNVVWSVTSSVVSEETKITESSGSTANLYVHPSETEKIEISADFEYDGQSYTTTYTLNNEPQVGSMTIFMDTDHTQYLGTTYTVGTETSVVLDAQYFPLYTGSVQDYDAAYTGDYATTFAGRTSFYLAKIDEEGSFGAQTTIAGVSLAQDSTDKSKVTVTIGSEVDQSFAVVCGLEGGMIVGFDFTPVYTTN